MAIENYNYLYEIEDENIFKGRVTTGTIYVGYDEHPVFMQCWVGDALVINGILFSVKTMNDYGFILENIS